jgi:cytidyltransferase-like protein
MILKFDELKTEIKTLKKHGKVGMCLGCFDLLHIGHIKHLEAAKKICDFLIVVVTPNKFVNKGPNMPVFDERYRMEAIDSIVNVTYVTLNKYPTAYGTIKELKPDYYIKGVDWKDSDSPLIKKEKELLDTYGGQLYFTERTEYSEIRTSNLVNRIKFDDKTKKFLHDFKEKYKMGDILEYIEKIKNIDILLLGETIIDEYNYGKTLGKSGKSPIVAFEIKNIESYCGGILALHNHLSNFTNKLDYGTGNKAIYKRRYIDSGQKLFETYEYDDNRMVKAPKKEIKDYDMVIVADFGHKYINKATIKSIKKSKFYALNTQLNAGNFGFNTINRYGREANFICIDENELKLAFSEPYETVENILLDNFDKDSLVCITRGFNGCMILKDNTVHNIPALATEVTDAVGAGDAFLSLASTMAYLDAPADIIGFVGNCAGAITCGWQCNKESVTKEKLKYYIRTLY